jgi:hypothetical protein
MPLPSTAEKCICASTIYLGALVGYRPTPAFFKSAFHWFHALSGHTDRAAGRLLVTALTRQIKRPLLIIWDGAAIHRSRKVKTWLQGQDGSLAVARLPAYAPELNPVEAIWAYLKKHEIANLCCDTIGEVGQFARNRLKSMQRRSHLIIGFWKQAELAF